MPERDSESKKCVFKNKTGEAKFKQKVSADCEKDKNENDRLSRAPKEEKEMLLKLYLLLLDKYTPAWHFYYNMFPSSKAKSYISLPFYYPDRHRNRNESDRKIGN